ncbi:CARDB domain-containing protein [Thermococcus sp.]
MKKSIVLFLIAIMIFGVAPTIKLASAQTPQITIDGNLSDWPANLLYSDPIGDGKWGANNDIQTFGFFTDGSYLYMAAVFKKDGWNNFMAMIDFSTRKGYPLTTGHPWSRRYKFAEGDIDFVIESWENGFTAWVVDSYGSFTDISSHITSAYGSDNGWVVAEFKIPLSVFGEMSLSDLKVKGVATLTGGFDGTYQWLSDVCPDQDIFPSWGTSGNVPAPAVLWKFLEYDPFTETLSLVVTKLVSLSVAISSNITDVEPNNPANVTVTISNDGVFDADNVNVTLYDNDIKVKNWTVTVPAKGKINLNYIYEYDEQKTGTHHLKAIVEYEGKNITASYKLYVGEIEIRRQNLMTAGMYIWPGLYMKRYEWSVNALEMAKGMTTTNESMNQINLLEKKLKENYRLFKKGFTLLQGNNPSPRGAFIVASAYYKIKGIQKEISELLKKLEAEGVMNKVTKVAEDMQHGEAGANLTALYLGSDDKYYYVVVDTGNTENWDVAYGIAIDAKDGGYNGTSDAWGRNLWFSFKADYEIYIYWSSEDNSIAATSFAEWNSGEWKYSKPSEAGIKVSYTKGSGGIKRLIFQIPLSLIPDPENAKVSAFVTGADPGTSAVDCLPYDRSINDQANEWNDLDWITTYATPNGTGSELPSEITIDGALADWQNAKVMIKEKNLNYAGANLAMLGVDYDENYLYIALEANNSENWDLSYGIALDVKDGGYTTGRDAWGKLIGFTEGVDYEIYGWWNSGTKRLEYNFGKDTGMQLVKYEDGKWTYDWNKQFKGFKAAYFGGTSGLQTVEIGIPWEAIDGRPKEVKVIAWIAGGDNTSAVVTVPDDKAVHDSTDEWKDTDTLSNFVKVMIK